VSGVPVTVIDPRPMKLDRYVKRFRKGVYHRNQVGPGGCSPRHHPYFRPSFRELNCRL